MLEQPRRGGRFATSPLSHDPAAAVARFKQFCQHEPETGCVVWIGGRTMGRGHHIPYGAFWFAGRRWYAHRFAARFVHSFDIDEFQVDHCCPNIPYPNTLCVEHVQPLTAYRNRELQYLRRRRMIHLQVGLVDYREVYGAPPVVPDCEGDIPFYLPPAWLTTRGDTNDSCPF